MTYKGYEMVAGLEIHVQLNTNSKIFCADENVFGSEPNAHTSVISLAHPGTLPVLNQGVIERGIALALSIGAKINQINRFDRKHYFYPDLPKAYQITQDDTPICVGGELDIYNDEKNVIRFHHVHLEEDAGKSIHDLDPQHSFIDLNRAGVPLLEIVTEPDFRSPQEIHDFIAKLQHLVRFIGISGANMEEGSLRCDCNVSVRKIGESELGERCEIKNINSKKFAKHAVIYETKRQINAILAGEEISKLTMQFDPSKGITIPIRDKEEVHDYRYFADPDIPPVYITNEMIDDIKTKLPTLPDRLYSQYLKNYQLSEEYSRILIQNNTISSYYKKLVAQSKLPKRAANLVINKILPFIKQNLLTLNDYPVSIEKLSELLQMIEKKKIAPSVGQQQLLSLMIQYPSKDVLQLAESNQLILQDQTELISNIVNQILIEHPEKVKKYKEDGKKNLMGFFIGQAMKSANGKLDPKKLKQHFISTLES